MDCQQQKHIVLGLTPNKIQFSDHLDKFDLKKGHHQRSQKNYPSVTSSCMRAFRSYGGNPPSSHPSIDGFFREINPCSYFDGPWKKTAIHD